MNVEKDAFAAILRFGGIFILFYCKSARVLLITSCFFFFTL